MAEGKRKKKTILLSDYLFVNVISNMVYDTFDHLVGDL